MQWMKNSVFIAAFYFMALSAESQHALPDTVLQLDGVTIFSERSGSAKGLLTVSLDSITRDQHPGADLAELIQGFSAAYVKNYGEGTLSTLSVRGTSANHTGLYWNGIKLSPPNIGYVDLSLIQGNFFQDVSIMFGGASPMFGSNAIGGSIQLNNKPVFDPTGLKGRISFSGGSFSRLNSAGNLSLSKGKLYSNTAFSIAGSENDFPYSDLYKKDARMPHAGYFKTGFLQDIAFQLPRNQYIMASAWFQYADREIPPTLLETVSSAIQLDRSWRTMLTWKDFNAKSTWEAKAAWIEEFTRYSDSLSGIYSVIRCQTFYAVFEGYYHLFRNASLSGGLDFSNEYADLDYYSSPAGQQKLAAFAAWVQSFSGSSWKLSLNVRQELQSGYPIPFLYAIGAEGRILKILTGRASFSRNFRAPTFNERYWRPGGNPALLPESSYNAEAGFRIIPLPENVTTFLDFTGFSSWVDNWILWLPGEGGLWSVENAQRVWARGVEVRLNVTRQFYGIKANAMGAYTFSASTNRKKLFELDQSFNKQLIYTPVHRFAFRAGAEWQGFSLYLKGNFSSRVYTTRDNSASLSPWFLLDAILAKSVFVTKRFPLMIQLNLENILDTEYSITPYRPMPGFNVLITIALNINEENK